MSVAGIAASYVALLAFVAVLRFNPRWWLSRHLFSQWGPRTDVPCMSRRELLAEGVRFFLLGALCTGAWLAVALVADALGHPEWPPVLAAGFLAFILGGMGIAAGLYMLLRGLFRRRRYVPPAECRQSRIAGAPATVPLRPPLAPLPAPAPEPGSARTA